VQKDVDSFAIDQEQFSGMISPSLSSKMGRWRMTTDDMVQEIKDLLKSFLPGWPVQSLFDAIITIGDPSDPIVTLLKDVDGLWAPCLRDSQTADIIPLIHQKVCLKQWKTVFERLGRENGLAAAA
jgi:hypothetical protein